MDLEAILHSLQNLGDRDLPEDLQRCHHCWGPVKGWASFDGNALCHPDFGLDCYHLVTVYDHEMACPQCVDIRVLLDRR
jgi:hypothetical protein